MQKMVVAATSVTLKNNYHISTKPFDHFPPNSLHFEHIKHIMNNIEHIYDVGMML